MLHFTSTKYLHKNLPDFKGDMFHTARWDYNVTGGSELDSSLHKLHDKKVGIIGTGSTAVQVIPELAKHARELLVFQRTPSQVNQRDQRDTDPEEWRNVIAANPGWQKRRQENFSEHVSLGAPDDHEDLIGDQLSKLKTFCILLGSETFGTVTPDKVAAHIDDMMARDASHLGKAQTRVCEIVCEREKADKLLPRYPTWCKRPTFSDTYLQAFNKRNVHLIDTDGRGIAGATERGVVVGEKEYTVDILIFSTGYRSFMMTTANPAASFGLDIRGIGGQTLGDKWAAEGASTLHGCATHGFPNLFFLGPCQAGASPNFAHSLDVISSHISFIIQRAHDTKGTGGGEKVVVEISADAEREWAARIGQGAGLFTPAAACHGSHLGFTEGRQAGAGQDWQQLLKRARNGPWPGGMIHYMRTLDEWRRDGQLKGVEVNAGSLYDAEAREAR